MFLDEWDEWLWIAWANFVNWVNKVIGVSRIHCGVIWVYKENWKNGMNWVNRAYLLNEVI